MSKITEIKKGDEFLCILDSEIPRFYTAGKTYVSDEDNSIRDNLDDCKHIWDIEVANKYFIKLEKTMVKKYRFIGESNEDYMWGCKPQPGKTYTLDEINIMRDNKIENEIDEGTIEKFWCKEPNPDWEIVIDPEVEKKEILDAVNPKHYKKGKVECIDAIEAATVDKKGIEAACTANIIKYIWRYESKDGLNDVKKAKWYLEHLIKYLENKEL